MGTHTVLKLLEFSCISKTKMKIIEMVEVAKHENLIQKYNPCFSKIEHVTGMFVFVGQTLHKISYLLLTLFRGGAKTPSGTFFV